jgi:hypothetical protein
VNDDQAGQALARLEVLRLAGHDEVGAARLANEILAEVRAGRSWVEAIDLAQEPLSPDAGPEDEPCRYALEMLLTDFRINTK